MGDRSSDDEKSSLDDGMASKPEFYQDTSDRSSSESSQAPVNGVLKEARDPESQRPVEHHVSLRTKLLFLAAYFFLNLFLTLSNKSVLGQVRVLKIISPKDRDH